MEPSLPMSHGPWPPPMSHDPWHGGVGHRHGFDGVGVGLMCVGCGMCGFGTLAWFRILVVGCCGLVVVDVWVLAVMLIVNCVGRNVIVSLMLAVWAGMWLCGLECGCVI